MDTTSLDLTLAILWTLGVFLLPTITLMITGAINIYVFGNQVKRTLDGKRAPQEFITDNAKRGALLVVIGVIVAAVLGIVCLCFAVPAWMAVAA